MNTPNNPRAGAAALGGAALIMVGLWWLLRATGIIPAVVLEALSRSAGALAVIGLGVALVVLSRRVTFEAPKAGTRLYRSRSDRWLGGVLGGLGSYLSIDPVALRVVVLLLTVVGVGVLVPAYIVMWVVVPEAPLNSAPPAAPAPPAPPASAGDGS